ncbi:MAG: hypothetical protein ABW092_01400 [Candidatus Thiodiazotropha sp.]
MRFPHLKIGQQFEYQGKRYTKTGPLTASDAATGASAMIRRSAEVTLVEAAAAQKPQAKPKQHYSRQEMLELCQVYKSNLKHKLELLAEKEQDLELDSVLALIDVSFDIP